MRTTITSADLIAILAKMATDMEGQKDYLCELDGAMGDGQDRRRWIEGRKSRGKCRAVGDEITLGQQQPVGDRGLLDRFFVFVELGGAVHRVDRGHHRVQPEERCHQRVVEQRPC